MTINNSTFLENSAHFGGGIYNYSSFLTVNRSVFSKNSVTDDAFGNSGGGGIISWWAQSMNVNNSTFSENHANDTGGGIDNRGTLNLNNSTFSKNSATSGAGIYTTFRTLNFSNTIIANSISGEDCFKHATGTIGTHVNNLVEDGSCSPTLSGDPGLGSLADNGGPTQTMSIGAGSPAYNAGDAATCLATDQRGVTRPLDGVCDIGAFEAGAAIPVVVSSVPSANAVIASLSTLTITFTQNMKNDSSSQAANNITNYLLVERGPNGSFDTQSCAGGLVSDDVKQTLSSAVYNNVTFTTTITTASPLTDGIYRLLVCGTTSIWSEAGLELNNGASDTLVNFTVATPVTTASSLPKTGFAPNKQTSLPPQPVDLKYASLGELRLDIPRLGVDSTIVGVPQSPDKTWDVTWLGNNIGWLNGTAFPTWNGNSVLTAHVTNSNGKNGPFADVKSLRYGDQVIVHMDGLKYIFEVRSTKLARPHSTGYAFQSMQDYAYLTLITCQGYNPISQTYLFRRVVRAVLLQVENE